MTSEYNSNYSYSTLQVVPGTEPQLVADRTLPQVVSNSPQPEKFHTADKYTYIQEYHPYDQTSAAAFATAVAAPTTTSPSPSPSAPGKKRQICGCGIPPKIFWALVYGAIILVLAAVGGGVGAALSNHNNGERVAADSAATTSGSATTTAAGASTTASSTRKATVPAQTAVVNSDGDRTLWRDCPAANDTIYTPEDYSGQQWRKECSNLFVGVKGQWVNSPGYESLNDCIDACAQFNEKNADSIKTGEQNPCSTVCWRNTWNTDYPGQCFGFTMANTTDGEFNLTNASKDKVCDSAAWINIDAWNTTSG